MNQSTSSINNKKYDESAFRTAVFIFFGNLLSMGGWLYISLQVGAWQLYLLTALLGIFIIADAAAVIFIRRGETEIGGWIIIAGIIILLAIGAFLNSGVALIAGISTIMLVNLIANLTLTTKPKQQALIISIVAGILTALLDQSNSEYRLFLPGIQTILPVISGVAALLLVFFITRQSWGIVTHSLRLKIAIWTGLILAGSAVILISYSTITGRQAAIVNAEKEALAIASSEAQSVRVEMEIPLNTARALANSLTALKDPSFSESLSRDQVNAMLRQVLIKNPSFLGTYTLWEPNAFDGLDATFKNTAAHDATGRFIPYWVRADDGSVDVSALLDYETPGSGDWYLLPRQTKKEVTIAPVIYPIKGVDTIMASFVVPILYNDKFYGIAGVDAPISFVQGIVDKVDLYNGTADAILMTSEGTLLGVRNKPELVNKPAAEIFSDFSDLQARLDAGESFVSTSPDGKYLRVFSPVDLGLTGKHWSFALIIPVTEITAPASTAAIQQGLIGIGLVLIALVILWVLSGQLASPVSDLTTVANAVSKGDLNVRAEVKATDETGVLANAFNLMITQLRESFSTLEQRVADRTRGLELAAEVGRTVSQVRSLDVLLTEAAEIIRSQFDLYYVQVYLTNPSQTALILQAGTGAVGVELLKRAHQLPLNTASINGRAAIEKRSVVITDTKSSATFKPNPLLPDTRSEMAVPLLIGERVVGVLDMQSRATNQLNQEGLKAFEALAGQLAITIQNATFLAQTEQARAEIEAQARRQSRVNWTEYLDAIHKPEETGFVYQNNKVSSLSGAEQQSYVQANESAVSAPIEITGESLGNLVVEIEGSSPISLTSELVSTVARQVAQQIENLRLLESAERYRSEAEEASRLIIHEGWKDYMRANAGEGISYIYDLNEVKPYYSDQDQQQEVDSFTTPLKARDEIIGKLVVQGINAGNNESIELVNAVAERLGSHLEGLRLSNQTGQALFRTQKLAEREQALRQITSAVRGSTDPEIILRAAARELGTILGRKTIIRLKTTNEEQPSQQQRVEAHGNESALPVETQHADGGVK